MRTKEQVPNIKQFWNYRIHPITGYVLYQRYTNSEKRDLDTLSRVNKIKKEKNNGNIK